MGDNDIGVIRRAFLQRKAFLKIGCFAGLLFCASLCFNSPVYGQEERGTALPDGDGKQLTTMVCSQCHGLKEIEILRDGQKGWQDTVDRMVLYGAQLSPSEADLVTRYLATQLGPDKGLIPDNGPMQSGTTPPQSTPGNATKKISLPAGPGKELVATRCAQCHKLEKVVSTTRSNADWESVTDNMVQRGMKATPNEVRTMISYLQANFSTNTPADPRSHTAADTRFHTPPDPKPHIQADPQVQEQSVRTGTAVFLQRCFQCHSVQPDQVKFGPSLYGEMRKPHPKMTAAEIRIILRDGKGRMPPFKDVLSKEDTDNLLAYIHGL